MRKIFRIEVHANRVLAKASRFDKSSRFLITIEIINLRLKSVPIRIHVVHARGRSLIRANCWPNTICLTLLVGSYETLHLADAISRGWTRKAPAILWLTVFAVRHHI